ncbi:hypothetical protein HDU67_005511 [Dinochytrium kinnereticum]|nr:hypothetical protein HDU67_005511 [Dinochytrium kinnereticum]
MSLCIWSECVLIRGILVFVLYRFNQIKLLGNCSTAPPLDPHIKTSRSNRSNQSQNDPAQDAEQLYPQDVGSVTPEPLSEPSLGRSEEEDTWLPHVQKERGCYATLFRIVDRWISQLKHVPTERDCLMILVTVYYMLLEVIGVGQYNKIVPCSLFLVSHFTSIVMPVMKHYYDEKRCSSKGLKINFDCFMDILEDPILFQSFKEFTAADLTVENAIFLEAYKELMIQYDKAIQKATKEKRRNSRKSQSLWPIKTSHSASLRSAAYLMSDPKSNHLAPTLEAAEDGQQVPDESTPAIQKSYVCGEQEEQHVEENTANLVPKLLINSYIRFYHQYIEEGSLNEVNLSFKVRDHLRKVKSTGVWRKDDFVQAREEVITNLVVLERLPTMG